MRWRLLLLTPWFVPGLAGGGITVSVRRMVEQLEADYDISVITRWHSDTQPAIRPDAWQPFGKCSRVVWLSRAEAWRGHRWIGTWHPDIVHVHGLYDPFVHVLSLRLRSRLFAARWVLSPHGMLDPGALAVRRLKKRLFLFAFRQTGLGRDLIFHASDEREAAHIRRHFPQGQVRIAPQIPEPPPAAWTAIPAPAETGGLRLLCLGAVHPKKNLLWLLDLLGRCRLPVRLTVAGPATAGRYLSRCRAAAAALPSAIEVEWAGAVPHEAVPGLLAAHHLLVLPTLGENFGHALFEALAHGRPLLISQATPWRHLRVRHAGFDLPLDQPHQWLDALTFFHELDAREWVRWQAGARRLATEWYGGQHFAKAYGMLYEP